MTRPPLATCALLVATIACDSAPITPVVVARPITLTLSSPEIEVARGQVEIVLASAVGEDGAPANVVFAIDSAPAGIRAQLSGYRTDGNTTSALIGVFVDQSVSIGAYHMAVRAIADSGADVVTSFSVLVQPSGTPAYTVESRPVSVIRGSSVVVNANIDRGANTGNVPVTLSAESLPSGVTASIYPVNNSKAIAYITLGVDATVPAGPHWLKLRGIAPAMNDRVSAILLQVLAK